MSQYFATTGAFFQLTVVTIFWPLFLLKSGHCLYRWNIWPVFLFHIRSVFFLDAYLCFCCIYGQHVYHMSGQCLCCTKPIFVLHICSSFVLYKQFLYCISAGISVENLASVCTSYLDSVCTSNLASICVANLASVFTAYLAGVFV